jgi:uncharacterized protein with HEPN domain
MAEVDGIAREIGEYFRTRPEVAAAAGFRSILVHDYPDVDLDLVYEASRPGLGRPRGVPGADR